jgi:hypothetical protein
MGVRDLTHGFMGGLKGIFVDPIRGAQEEGYTLPSPSFSLFFFFVFFCLFCCFLAKVLRKC